MTEGNQVRRGRGRRWSLVVAVGLILTVSACLVGFRLSTAPATSNSPSAPSSLAPAESASGQGWAASTSATSITTNSFTTASADVVIVAVTIWDSTVVPSISDTASDTYTSCGVSSAISTPSMGPTYVYCFYTTVGTVVSSMTVTSVTSSTVEMSIDVVSFAGMIAITNVGYWGYESGTTTTVSASAFSTESLVIVSGFVRYTGAVTAPGFTEDSGGTDVTQDYPAIFWDLDGAGNNVNQVTATAAISTAAALIMLAIMTGSAAEANGASSMTTGWFTDGGGFTVAACLTTYDTTLSSITDTFIQDFGGSYSALVSNYVNTYDSNLHQYLYASMPRGEGTDQVTVKLAGTGSAQIEAVVIPSTTIIAANSGGSSTDTSSFQQTLTSPDWPYLGMICQGIDRYSGGVTTSPSMTRAMDGFLPSYAFNNMFVSTEDSSPVTETTTAQNPTPVSTIMAAWAIAAGGPCSLNSARFYCQYTPPYTFSGGDWAGESAPGCSSPWSSSGEVYNTNGTVVRYYSLGPMGGTCTAYGGSQDLFHTPIFTAPVTSADYNIGFIWYIAWTATVSVECTGGPDGLGGAGQANVSLFLNSEVLTQSGQGAGQGNEQFASLNPGLCLQGSSSNGQGAAWTLDIGATLTAGTNYLAWSAIQGYGQAEAGLMGEAGFTYAFHTTNTPTALTEVVINGPP